MDQHEARDRLRQEWGDAFDENIALAQKAIIHYGGQDLWDELDRNSAVGNSVPLARAMAKLGRELQEQEATGQTSLADKPAYI